MEKQIVNEGRQEIWFLTPEEVTSMEGECRHKENFRRAMEPIQHCKVELYPECIQGTFTIPRSETKQRDAFDFGFYMDEDRLIFIENGGRTISGIREVQERLSSSHYGEADLKEYLLMLFEYLIEDDVLELQQIEHSMESIEELLLERLPEHFYQSIIEQRKQLSRLHSYYEQLTNMGDLMEDNYNQMFTKEECTAWTHYTGKTERLHNHVEQLMEYLVQIRELYQTQIDKQQNRVMSFLTVVTTIFLPLTLIAGWYGMNFPGMPEFGWKYGYPVVIALSIGIIVAEIIYFRRKRML